MNIEQARINMIEQQIRPWDVLDPNVLSLLEAVRREDFVPAAYRSLAFVDMAIPLPDGQYMLEPKVEARLLQELQLQRHETVLEIGAGSGYMAALMGCQASRVISLERSAALARMAADNLQHQGATKVTVRNSDGRAGLPAEAPFDAIVLSGSVSRVPAALLEQLQTGGRLVAIVGEVPVMRARLYTRVDAAAWSHVDLFDTLAPRLHGFDEPERFRF